MLNNMISQSLPKRHLGLFDDEGNVDVERTTDFVEASRAELAAGLGLSPDQIRPERLTGKAKDRLEQLAATLEFVAETFSGDIKKTKYWMKTPNLHFGGISPRQLILRGKYQKVFQFVLDAQKA